VADGVSTRVVIADDEAPARRIVRTYLRGRADAEVVGEAENGLEVVEMVRTLEPDLVVLDIQMPGLTGFEVIDAVGAEAMPAVVFATAYDEYALRAFDVHAVDYLLKPFTRERFGQAFERALERRPIAPLVASMPLERVVVRERDRLFFVPVDQILHLSAEGNYVRVHTAEKSHLVRGTLAELEARLDAKRFARIHRSGIVNIAAIREVRAHFHGDYIVTLRTGETLRLSRRYQARLLG
jgi:two-component system LytT family response regulator